MIQSSTQSAPPCLLVDASIYIFQYYFALPDHWFSRDHQWPTAAVYGYAAWLARLLKQQHPQYIAACFDESLSHCFRNQLYPDYKSSRALPDEALAFQLKACRQVTELLGITCYSSKTHEADDLLGSLYSVLQHVHDIPAIGILTRDKDLGQLLNRKQDYLWDYNAKNTDNHGVGQRYFSDDIQQKFGVLPSQLVDYLALVGDPVDDIPGLPGVGAKTAQRLLQHFGSVQAMLDNPQAIANDLNLRGAKALIEKLDNYRDQLLLSQTLATVVTDLDLIPNAKALCLQAPQWSALADFCHEMGFPALLHRLKKSFETMHESMHI